MIFSKISKKNWCWFFTTVVAVVALDQLSKYLILKNLTYGQSIQILPGLFNLVLTFNLGAAFGLLSGLEDGTRQLVLMLTTGGALIVVFYFLLFEFYSNSFGRLALAMILGGAMGNIIDRIRLGKVVDFLDFYIKDMHWPAFNLADSAICVAVFILILIKPGRKQS